MPFYLPHFNLQTYNTLASPVSAAFFVSVNSEDELIEALRFAYAEKLPLLVLGGGSNIVLADDFPGLALHVNLLGKEVVREDESYVYVKAAAGENWHGLVEYCLDYHYWGLENLSLIPGSVGAAPIQNIGAYGVELRDVFSELTAIDIQSGLAVTFVNESCQFGYRDSVFKHALKDKYIITSVTLKLDKKPRLKTNYGALQLALRAYDEVAITPLLISEIVCGIRRSKLPDPQSLPNVGSFFKNPVITVTVLADLQQAYPDIVFYPAGDGYVKLAAAWLIERAGWKGYSDDGVAVHQQQALVLTNPHRVRGDRVLALAAQIRDSVRELFAVDLEQEPRTYP